ncbi:alkaline phosphatase D family protein [Pseudobacteriovorax antillogorgiicola]|uniref:Alkaline phosphatase D n=1 Tax=Pseudobacteriovorax antillogorgiicola TaxID=1513793 RepID=A0A1Y6BFG6_9BACT|nr:alkaline phosphatase D family protein [Pseudobacteriovorax antillogorgiicola]TCS57422.1 alkaline phosphatase D [Pseudobacteriovorax antillogorgiicola]SMF01284.1 alkaline phosphatase D [Pseudobacteriovorax antillogorgiicola]
MGINRRDLCRLFGFSLLTPYTRIQGSPFGPKTSGLNSTATATIFPLSVASGDPAPHGVVIWTKLDASGVKDGLSLYFEVSLSPMFDKLVYVGEVESEHLIPDRDYTVSIDLNAEAASFLESDQRYFYRFIYDGVVSRTGRFRTLPEPGKAVNACQFALLTCQDFSSGYFYALRHLAAEEIDFVIHLGDFIYEYAAYPGQDNHVRTVDLDGRSVAESLEDFRAIYRTYRRDPNLQLAMENHTWIVTWDDHETANNAYWDYGKDTLGLEKDHPLSLASSETKRRFKRASQQAWLEYIPARVHIDHGAEHPHQFLRIYRNFRYGDLMDLFMMDTRTYRTEQPCIGKNITCKDYAKPIDDDQLEHSMLGSMQRQWLIDGVTESECRWQLVGNQTLFSQFGLTGPWSGHTYAYLAGYDGWDGYQSERDTIIDAVKNAGLERFVVLTGDFHTYLASFIKLDFSQSKIEDTEVIGLELMTPSVTSANFATTLAKTSGDKPQSEWNFWDRASRALGLAYSKTKVIDKVVEHKIRTWNDHFQDFGGNLNGYALLKVERDSLRWSIFHIDPGADSFEEAPKLEVRAKRYHPNTNLLQDIN